MDINDISPELQEKARACETVEELHELLKEEGMEIPDEELEAVAGGSWCSTKQWFCVPATCPDYTPRPCHK